MSKYIGFDTLQLKTLRLLIEEYLGDNANVQDELDALDARITALENAEPAA